MKRFNLPTIVVSLSLALAQAGTAPFASADSPAAGSDNLASKLKFNRCPVKPTMTEEHLQSAVEQIDKQAQKLIDDGVVPGLAISVVHDDKLVFSKGYGVREVGKPEKIDADTVFQLASVSKAVASTVVAAVAGEKTVTWDSRVSDLDPAFALEEPWVTSNLTIRDLFCHRSGLPDHSGDILEDLGYSQAEVLHRL